VGGDDVYVLEDGGALFHGSAAGCAPAKAPAPLREVAAFPGRVVAIGRDGVLWRQRGGGEWRRLPAVRKYRPGRRPYTVEATQVSVSETSTWLLDNESTVFLLSDELEEASR
jgi:hypothetical protein